MRTLCDIAAASLLIGAAVGTGGNVSSLGNGLLTTTWAQRGAYAQFAPQDERLGCASTAFAQIMFFHRLCPTGSVSYQAPGFPTTAMDYDQQAKKGLCDWSQFTAAPKEGTTEMTAVARYSYAAALTMEKKWGTGSYMLTHAQRIASAEKHYNVKGQIVLADAPETEQIQAIKEEVDNQRPLQMHIRNKKETEFHFVVIDGYKQNNDKFMVHLNLGHGGGDNGWFDFHAAIKGYDDINYHELWKITPAAMSVIV